MVGCQCIAGVLQDNLLQHNPPLEPLGAFGWQLTGRGEEELL